MVGMKTKKIVLFKTSFFLSAIVCVVVMLPPQRAAAEDAATVTEVSSRYRATADDMMVEGRYVDAADLYQRALEQSPKSVRALAGLGMALGRQLKLDEADVQFDKALELDPQNPVAHCGKAMTTLSRIQALSDANKKERLALLRQAGKECNAAIDADPRVVEAHYLLGRVYKEEGRLDRAAQAFSGAIRLDPKYVNAYTALGNAQILRGQLNEAIDTFGKALQLNSKSSAARYGLGQVYLNQGKTDKAIAELLVSISQYPDSAPVHIALARAYEEQGNLPSAINEYQESIRIKPELTQPYLAIADLRNAQGEMELAIAQLRKGLQAIPNNTELRLSIADKYMKTDRFDEAIIEYEAILNRSINHIETAYALARALYLRAQRHDHTAFINSRDFERATNLIAQTIKSNPDNTFLRLAQSRLQLLINPAYELKGIGAPKNDVERVALAETLLAQGKFNEASDMMKTAIANASTAKDVFSVADIAFMIKDLDNAEIGYKKAGSFSNAGGRAKLGQESVTKAKEVANQNAAVAKKLLRSRNIMASIERYREANFQNPRSADARLGLAEALERLNPKSQAEALRSLREAIFHYQAYLSLSPIQSNDDQEEVRQRVFSLQQKAAKLEKNPNLARHNGLERLLQIPKLHVALPKLNDKR